MIFALLGNIDGHADALKRTLDAIEEEGIVTVLCTGNVAWGSGGSAVIGLLRERGVRCVQGARDRALSKLERKRARIEKELGAEFGAYETAHAALRSADIEWLGKLPHEVRLGLDGCRVLLCHGIPGDQHEHFAPGTSPARLQRAREAADADIVASGGGFGAFAEEVGDCLLLNAPTLVGDGAACWLRVNTDPSAGDAELVEVALTPSGT